VANSNDNAVVVISDVSDAIVATITMSSANADPYDVAYDSSQGAIYVANHGDNTVSVISGTTNTVTATITVGTLPEFVTYDSVKNEVFVSNSNSKSVSIISSSASSASSLSTSSPTASASSSPTTSPAVPEFNNIAFISVIVAVVLVSLSAVAFRQKMETETLIKE